MHPFTKVKYIDLGKYVKEKSMHLKVSFKLPFENGIFFLQLLESPHASAHVHAKPLSNLQTRINEIMDAWTNIFSKKYDSLHFT